MTPRTPYSDRRDTMRFVRVACIVAGGCLALGLAYSGFREIGAPRQTVSDSVYHALRVFRLDADVPDGQVPWQLDVARFLAPLVVAYAALAAALALARHRVEAWLVRRRAHDHVVVIGSGEHANAVVEALRHDRDSRDKFVVVVDDGRDSARRSGLRAAGARVITADTSQPAAARAARVHRARDVVILVGSDSDNLQALAAAAHSASVASATGPNFHVSISDFATWEELGRHALTVGTEDRTEFFNLTDRTARRLVDEAVELSGEAALERCLIDGSGAMAVRTASHLVRRGLHSGTYPKLFAYTGSAERLVADLAEAEPWCLDAADIVTLEDAEPCDATIALVVGGDDDAVLLARGLSLVHRLPSTRVIVGLPSAHVIRPADLIGVPVDRLTVVNAEAGALARDLRENATFEILARAKHEDYVLRERQRGVTLADNPSLLPWDKLEKSLQDSNRRFAEAVGPMVGQLGASIRPLTRAPVLTDLDVPPALLERLAEREHERWMSERMHDGWRPTTEAKDPRRRLHPLLVPWKQLPESEKEKDRDVFRALPRMLSYVGYELVVPDTASAPEPHR